MMDANLYTVPDAAPDPGRVTPYEPSIFNFDGRIGRLRYLAYSIGINLMLLLSVSIGLFYITSFVISIMFAKRRLNDLNRSGWWFLLFLVPIVNLLLGIYLIFFPGTDGSNDYGPPPVANSTGVLILGWGLPVILLFFIVAAIAIPEFAGMAPY